MSAVLLESEASGSSVSGVRGDTQTQSRQMIGQEVSRVHFSNLSGVVSPEGLDWARRGGDNMRKGT